MKANVGSIDRIALGAALIAAAVPGVIGPWGWLGLRNCFGRIAVSASTPTAAN